MMNQYRCENCDYFKDNDCMSISNQGVWLSSEEYDMVKTVGCASHSDFQSERDKVIVILNNLYTDCLFLSDGSLECNAMCDKVRGILEELREGKDGEKE